MARSVIVLDEAQTLPLRLLRPCLAALKELVHGYGSSVVLCTATQPALLRGHDGAGGDGFPAEEGFEPHAVRELAPDPPRLYGAFRRVRVQDAGVLDDEALGQRLRAADQVLAIVNNRRHARALFDRLREVPGAALLTTWMTPAHRRAVLADIRARREAGDPVRLVATSLIEAGVDVDFPEVWREVAGIDSIAQAAGRCNREGRRKTGEVYVFRSASDFRPPADLEQFAEVGRAVLEAHDDPLSRDAVRAYFRDLYWRQGPELMDRAEVAGKHGILTALAEAGNELDFPFADIAGAFRMIPEGGLPLVIRGEPWGIAPTELDGLQHNPHAGTIARALQPVTVQLPARLRAELIAAGAASFWCADKFGEQFVVLDNPRLYNETAGFSPEDPENLGGMIL